MIKYILYITNNTNFLPYPTIFSTNTKPYQDEPGMELTDQTVLDFEDANLTTPEDEKSNPTTHDLKIM